MKKILVVGANGQLGNCIQKLEKKYIGKYHFHFTDSTELDVTNEDNINEVFSEIKPQFCINASAYTAVDLAEKEESKAFAVNAFGVENLATACQNHHAFFIHVSTDYVFSGESNISYDEDNFTQPMGVYGKSKLKGEELALENCRQTIILRTSWLYSEFNKNFVKTMLNLFSQKDELNIVSDQYGQPTNANDLAEAIMNIIEASVKKTGIYHFSNYPETTWFHFAEKIAEFSASKIQLNKITTEEYPTPAKRPKRSTMALDKIQKDYDVTPKNWENSLKKCVEILKNEV